MSLVKIHDVNVMWFATIPWIIINVILLWIEKYYTVLSLNVSDNIYHIIIWRIKQNDWAIKYINVTSYSKHVNKLIKLFMLIA